MKLRRLLQILPIAAAVAALSASSARAQDAKVEIGASLASLNFSFGEDRFGEDDNVTTFSVPSGFGIQPPGVFVSFFVGPRLAIEPQISLFVASANEDTFHTAAFAGQVDYFFKGSSQSSPYLFGAVGTIDASGEETNPVLVSAGAGYRMRVGDNLTFRFDGRYTHVSNDGDGGNVLSFGVSIGGLLGR